MLKKIKKTKKAEDFVHLHLHSDASTLDGCGKVGEYVETAAKRGSPAIAFTEHGTMRNCHTSQVACSQNDIKAVHGIEFYVCGDMNRKGLTDDERSAITNGVDKAGDRKAVIKEYEQREGIRERTHLTVWAKNEAGLKNLYRLSSEAYIHGFYYKPRIDIERLLECSEGLIVGTGCMGSVVNRPLLNGKKKKALAEAERLRECFGEDLWIEIQPHAMEEQALVNKFALELKKRWGKNARLLATQDAHYVLPTDAVHHECLLCIGMNQNLSDPNRFRFDNRDFYFKTRRQMRDTFLEHHAYLGKANIKESLDSTVELASACEAKMHIDYHAAYLPHVELPEGMADEWEYLKSLCSHGLAWRDIAGRAKKTAVLFNKSYPEMLDVYSKRMRHELGALKRQGFVSYFLIVHDLYAWARGEGIMCGPGRGSVAGSLVSFLLGFTSVDPIEHGLIFERFINPNRVDAPDVDMDFEDVRRQEVFEYLRQKYGQDKVAQIATVGKLSGKQCLKDVSRVLEVPYAAVNEVTNSIIERSSGDERASQTIEDSFKDFAVCREFNKKYPDVLKHSKRLEGMAKNLGIHAAGCVVAPEPLVEYLPLEIRKHDGRDVVVTALDMGGVSALGLVKLDVLGLRTLSVLRNCLDAVEERTGERIDLENDVPLDDKKALKLFTDHDYVGIFQYDTPSADKICSGVKFKKFEDIAAMTALNRPGTARSGLATQYVARKKNPKLIEKAAFHPAVSKITEDTLGIIVYQEHVIKIFTEIAGFAPGTADSLRKSIAKKHGDETIGKERANFIKGATERTGMTVKEAEKIIDAITFFGCLEKSTEVLTPTGVQRIDQLKPGDKIVSTSEDGFVENEVKRVEFTGVKSLRKITTNVGSIYATDEHYWRTPYNRYVQTKDLNPGKHLFSPKPEGGQRRSLYVVSMDRPQGSAVGETYDIEVVNEPHNYVLANGVTSHNSYGFNKSHATAYGIIAYWGMWLKAHHPVEFYWALLKNEPQRIRIQTIARDAKDHGIELLPPDVSSSGSSFTIDGNAIRGSLMDIKNVGEKAAETIMDNQPYKDFRDFYNRVDRRKCHKGVVAALVKAGALDTLVPNTKWFLDNLETVWTLLGKGGDALDKILRLVKKSKKASQYTSEEKQLIASQVNPLAFGRHPIDAYQKFIDREVKVPLVSMSEDNFFKDYNNASVFVYGVIVEVKYNQIGDFHTGALPSEAEREKEGWGLRYSNVNVEDGGGVQNRIKFDVGIFDEMRPVIDAGVGTPVVVHATVNGKFQNLRANFAIDLEAFRKKIENGDELNQWEMIAQGHHPAHDYPWKTEEIKTKRLANAIVDAKMHQTGPFCGVVTNLKTKYDKNDREMAFFGLMGVKEHIEVICFASDWRRIRSRIKMGELVIVVVEKQSDRWRGVSFICAGAQGVRQLKKSALKQQPKKV